ncbi:hypothetical protein, partial [Brachybacterium atlanticum]|uniref:hypothetical protein n=1 Tax=Brachybacterium atlanticum TaxID=2911888 RepID=UPI0021DFCC41
AAGTAPLEGTVHAPRSRSVSLPRRRGRWLTVGVPVVLAGVLGISSFMLLGVSALVGGAGLLTPFLASLGIAAVAGGGSAFLLRNRRPRPTRLGRSAEEISSGTRAMLEKIVKDSTQQRRRIHRMRRRIQGPTEKRLLDRAETLLLRVDALLGSAALQSRRASDPDVMLLEGMTERYVPELVGALEDTVGFLTPGSTEDTRARAAGNLQRIDEQLAVLDGRLDRLEHEVVSGVSRTLDVHSEFLRARFSEPSADPAADR